MIAAPTPQRGEYVRSPLRSGPGPAKPKPSQRILLLGATGSIGREAARALIARGHEVVCPIRPASAPGPAIMAGAEIRPAEIADPAALARDGFRGERFDALVSCLASRSGAPRDAWAIDHDAHLGALGAAQAAGVGHFVQLSALCVQKPKLAFQHAKRAFEQALQESGLAWTIVRPTAFFKSLSGQIDRVRQGKPYLLFGDGRLTACKPIAERDLGAYLADCVEDPKARGRILPIGGPGPAITPREQGEALFRLFRRAPRFRRVPVAAIDAVAAGLALGGAVSGRLRDAAEFARIARYYATESMLVWDEGTKTYRAEATPEYGTQSLLDFYAAQAGGAAPLERGEHALF